MSYTLYAYLIDLEKLKKSVGSKNESLIAKVIGRDPNQFEASSAHNEVSDEDDDDDEEISMNQALQDLVMGNPLNKESAHQYGYVLEQLCGTLGTQATHEDEWCGIRWDVLEMIGMDELLQKSGPPIQLPRIDDFPAIGHLTTEQIDKLISRMEKGPLITAAMSGRKPKRSWQSWVLNLIVDLIAKQLVGGRQRGALTPDDVREQLDCYESWIRAASAEKKSLVFFYY